jgi:uncharacterized membrane protein
MLTWTGTRKTAPETPAGVVTRAIANANVAAPISVPQSIAGLYAGGFRRLTGLTSVGVAKAIVRGSSLRYSRDQGEFDRAIGFVDATYALALTLLVTTLDVGHPHVAFSSLGALDDAVGQQFVAFAIAFAVIASYWLQHHRLIASFAAIDYTTTVVNLFLIAAIVLLPFSTQAVGDPGVKDLALPSAIMAVNVVAASVLHTLVYVVAVRRNLLSAAPSRGEVSYNVVNGLAAAAVFAASVPVAYLTSPITARITWISLIPISWLLARYTASWRTTDAV